MKTEDPELPPGFFYYYQGNSDLIFAEHRPTGARTVCFTSKEDVAKTAWSIVGGKGLDLGERGLPPGWQVVPIRDELLQEDGFMVLDRQMQIVFRSNRLDFAIDNAWLSWEQHTGLSEDQYKLLHSRRLQATLAFVKRMAEMEGEPNPEEDPASLWGLVEEAQQILER